MPPACGNSHVHQAVWESQSSRPVTWGLGGRATMGASLLTTSAGVIGAGALTTDIDDLSRAILAWLDQRPTGVAGRSPSSSWSTTELQKSFRDNLESTLRATIKLSQWAEIIAYLVKAFNSSIKVGQIAHLRSWDVAPYQKSHPETFDVIRDEMTSLLERNARIGVEAGPSSTNLADRIVGALNEALEDESRRVSEGDIAPDAILHYYMFSGYVKRRYNVRNSLYFFGAVLVAAVLYSIIEPNFWLNAGTASFMVLAYVTLIVTFIVYNRSDVRPE